jgi:leucine dehydrogenase
MGNDIFSYAASMECPELHIFVDETVHLKAIVAIHSTVLGPALGGCRCIEYSSTDSAIIDAIRLAQGMTFKAAISNLPLGGGKMVLLKPKTIPDRKAYFKAVGRFVETLKGRYITAEDSGTSVADMDNVSTETQHVVGITKRHFSEADPSVMTAMGVERGIQAAVEYKLKTSSLKDVHIAIQGLGHVGYNLAKRLHKQGARLSVFDVRSEAVQRAIDDFGAKAVASLEALLSLECDVFAPSALGGIINDHSLTLLKSPIIAGSANNQLEDARHGKMMLQKNILYAPDYVINAGGLIYVAAEYNHMAEEQAKVKINEIYDTLMQIFKRSEQENKSTSEIADRIAQERLLKA